MGLRDLALWAQDIDERLRLDEVCCRRDVLKDIIINSKKIELLARRNTQSGDSPYIPFKENPLMWWKNSANNLGEQKELVRPEEFYSNPTRWWKKNSGNSITPLPKRIDEWENWAPEEFEEYLRKNPFDVNSAKYLISHRVFPHFERRGMVGGGRLAFLQYKPLLYLMSIGKSFICTGEIPPYKYEVDLEESSLTVVHELIHGFYRVTGHCVELLDRKKENLKMGEEMKDWLVEEEAKRFCKDNSGFIKAVIHPILK